MDPACLLALPQGRPPPAASRIGRRGGERRAGNAGTEQAELVLVSRVLGSDHHEFAEQPLDASLPLLLFCILSGVHRGTWDAVAPSGAANALAAQRL
jgi:hypothetical protein